MHFPDFKKELDCLSSGYDLVIGCDEVGVSPLAGPVVSAACVLDPSSISGYRSKNKWYYRVRDSKTTSEEEREELVKKIMDHSLAYGLGIVSEQEIDRLNIHNASLKAMKLATEDLLRKLQLIRNKNIVLFLDGRFRIKDLETDNRVEQRCVIKGDCKVLSISAASIIAKVHRDKIMHGFDTQFPGYGFGRHKGYNTREHQKALRELGATHIHRNSFFRKGWLRDVKNIPSMNLAQDSVS